MSRAVLVKCTVCDGKGKTLGEIKCTCCKGSGAVPPLPDVIGLSGKSCRAREWKCPKGHTLDVAEHFNTKWCPECADTMYTIRTALKEAATNYSAALLMSKADADTVNAAFRLLEEASFKYAKTREGMW